MKKMIVGEGYIPRPFRAGLLIICAFGLAIVFALLSCMNGAVKPAGEKEESSSLVSKTPDIESPEKPGSKENDVESNTEEVTEEEIESVLVVTPDDEIIYLGSYPPWTHGLKNGLNEELKKQIQQDLWDNDNPKETAFYIEKGITKERAYPIVRYYGTYNGCVVIIPYYAVITVTWGINIDGIIFAESCPPVPGIIVWKEGSLYTLKEAYEQGFLTRNDLLKIADTQRRIKEAEDEYKNK